MIVHHRAFTLHSAPRVIRVMLPSITPTLNEILRLHWRKRQAYQRQQAWILRAAIGRQRPASPFARAHVRIERRSTGTADHDGFIGGLKLLIDCLLPASKQHPCGLGIIADDNPAVMTLDAVQVRVRHRVEQQTILAISEVLE
jgi:hypothetical protein